MGFLRSRLFSILIIDAQTNYQRESAGDRRSSGAPPDCIGTVGLRHLISGAFVALICAMVQHETAAAHA